MTGGPAMKRYKSDIDYNDREKIKRERESLPVWEIKSEIIERIHAEKTSIIIGETGSGKSTQIPQFCHEAGLNGQLLIAVTQPRKVAAISLATRVADELNCQLGGMVGYNVRFDNITSNETVVIYVTDGMLLREALHDPLLKRYGVILIDEAHERTLHTDIMFGVVKKAQRERSLTNSHNWPPLRLVVMSATMDVDSFSEYFNGAPVYFVEGRTYPVQVFYASNLKSECEDYVFNSLVTVFQLHKTEPIDHHFLVFLTGQDEIEAAIRRTRETGRHLDDGTSILPMGLYAALSRPMQMKVFQPLQLPNCRKVIFATNIAETSLTIVGVKVIIDSGKVKMRTYQPKNRLELLRVGPVSQAQACQRAGRAGRDGPGKCFRLYSQRDMDSFAVDTQPEIERCSVSAVVLELLRMGIEDVMTFDFMKKPSEDAYRAAIYELYLLDAIESLAGEIDEQDDNDENEGKLALTFTGQQLVQFPIEPKFAKILLAASKLGCLEEALDVVSILSYDNIFISSTNKKADTIGARQKYECLEGDHLMLHRIYKAFIRVNRSGNAKAVKDWCAENAILMRHMRMVEKIRHQLRGICVKLKLPMNSCGNDCLPLRRAICSGLFMNACDYDPNSDSYSVLGSNLKVRIHPSSCLSRSKPSALVFTDLIMTTQLYARDVTVVDLDWVKELLRDSSVDRFAN